MRSAKEPRQEKKRKKHINFNYLQERFDKDKQSLRRLQSDYNHEGSKPMVGLIIGVRYLWRRNGAKKSQFYISWFENNNKLTREQELKIREMKLAYKVMLKIA